MTSFTFEKSNEEICSCGVLFNDLSAFWNAIHDDEDAICGGGGDEEYLLGLETKLLYDIEFCRSE